MQTDTWLTETPYPERCPLCSQPLADNSNKCPSCGFITHESAHPSASMAGPSIPRRPGKQPDPATPIPARASAVRAHRSQIRPASQQIPARKSADPQPDAAPERQVQTGNRQHNSPSYAAASSLSSLSLIISETPTAPPRSTQRLSSQTGSLEHIDEIDTLPPLPTSASADNSSSSTSLASLADIEEIDTIPQRNETSARALVSVHSEPRERAVDAASWTTSTATGGDRGKAARIRQQAHPRPHRFHLLDRLRWWLLRPGHIEFLLWLVGSILLFGITFLLLLATALSMMLPGAQSGGNLPNSATANSTRVTTSVATPGSSLHLALSGNAQLTPGAEIQLHGQGFAPRSKIAFLLDGRWPLLDQNGRAAVVQADSSGSFTVNLWLGRGSAWSAGSHQVLARESGNNRQVSITIAITTGTVASVTQPAGNPGPGSNGPAPQPQPTTVPSRPQPTPVPTERPPTPAPTTQPTAQPTSAPTVQPTPTSGASPVPSPTTGGTPLPPTVAATHTGSSGSNGLGNALNNNNDNSLLGRLSHLNPLIWLIVASYTLSMTLLVLAGLLRRRRPPKEA